MRTVALMIASGCALLWSMAPALLAAGQSSGARSHETQGALSRYRIPGCGAVTRGSLSKSDTVFAFRFNRRLP
jgi:hypothetical protein